MALSGADTGVGACLVRNIGCEENQARKQQDFADVSRIPKPYCLYIPVCKNSAGIRLCVTQSVRYGKLLPFSPFEYFQIQIPQLREFLTLFILTFRFWDRTSYTPVYSNVIKKSFPKLQRIRNCLSTGSISLSHGRKTTQSLIEPLPDWVCQRLVSPFSRVWEKASWDSSCNGLTHL